MPSAGWTLGKDIVNVKRVPDNLDCAPCPPLILLDENSSETSIHLHEAYLSRNGRGTYS
jgi:hypothetical protein